jgi:transcription antitermination factor NusG
MGKNWYAVYTKPGLETKVVEALTKRKFQNYCPLNMFQKQPSGQKKITYEPLFASYVFVRAEDNQLVELKSIGGIINFIYWLNKPAVIENEEINTINKFLNDYENVQLRKTNVKVNGMVSILDNSQLDFDGNTTITNSEILTVTLPSLGYIMMACVKKQNVKVIINKTSSTYATIR